MRFRTLVTKYKVYESVIALPTLAKAVEGVKFEVLDNYGCGDVYGYYHDWSNTTENGHKRYVC